MTDCYLTLGLKLPLDVRQKELSSRYFFSCFCESCFERWPPVTEMPKALQDVHPDKFKFALDDVRTMQAQFGKVHSPMGEYVIILASCTQHQLFASSLFHRIGVCASKAGLTLHITKTVGRSIGL